MSPRPTARFTHDPRRWKETLDSPIRSKTLAIPNIASLAVVARTAAHLSTVVDDLMFLARADAAALSPRRITFSLDELVEETVEASEPEAKAKGSRLVLRPRSKGIELDADPAQIQRLVAILVDNALRHAAPGDVDISMNHFGKQVELRVESSGPGIPADLLPRVFDRFVRGDGSRAAEGSGLGLGLAIAKSIASAHGGTIRIQNGGRGGVTAIVRIPKAPLRGRPRSTATPSATTTKNEA